MISTTLTICAGFLLLSHELHSQIIFQDAGFTTPPSTAFTASNQYYYGTNPTNQYYYGNNPTTSSYYYNGYNPYPTTSSYYYNGNNPSVYIQTTSCICVNTGRCFAASGNTPTGGSGIDIRIVNTVSGTSTGSISAVTTPASSGITTIIASQSTCSNNLEFCCPPGGVSCGIRMSPFAAAATPVGSQAPFGSYPWQAVILTTSNIYVASGALIDHMHILTVAHKVNAFLSNGIQLKVRMGEWDAANTNEPIASQEFIVARIFVHPQYSPTTLSNSIAILRVSSAVPIGQTPTITTGCLSSANVAGLRCWVAGWGASSFTSTPGASGSIQTQVDVPLVDQSTCQTKLRTTRLGTNFILDTNSFLCAGGEAGKDACTGDGGSPLVCPIAGRWYIIGLVAWGIGCGTTDVPGVYINVTRYLSWIQSTTSSP